MTVGMKKLVALPKLRETRQAAEMSMTELHELSGASVSTIHALETGDREAHRSTAARLARALGVPVEVLAGASPPTAGVGDQAGGGGRSGLALVMARRLAEEAALAEARREAEATGKTVGEVLAGYEREYEAGLGAVLVGGARALPAPEAVARARARSHEPIGLASGSPGRGEPSDGVSEQFRRDKNTRGY